MARPRRTKVVSHAPRVAAEPTTPDTITTNKTMATKGTRKGGTPAKKSRKKSKEDASNVQTPRAKPTARGRPVAKRIIADEGQNRALDALRQRRDAALRAKGAKKSPVVESVASKLIPKAVQGRSSSESGQTAKEKVTSTPRTKQAAEFSRHDRTPSDKRPTDDDLYGLSPGGEASKVRIEAHRQSTQQAPPSALKAQGTPAVETSVLALANFKRRPRQPSIIRMIQQTSELGNDDEDYLKDLDDTLGDFDNFDPEDESTPLHVAKQKMGAGSASKLQHEATNEPRSSSSRKRKQSMVEEEEVQVLCSSPPLRSSPPRLQTSHSPSRSLTASSLPDHIIPSTEQEVEVQDQDMYSDTMAPPCSSSPPPSPVKTGSQPGKRRRISKGNFKGAIAEDHEAQGSLVQPRKPRNIKKIPTISTAALQSLLPKTRQKTRGAKRTDAYDIPSSDDIEDHIAFDSDNDELAKTPMRKVDGNHGKFQNRAKTSASTHKSLKGLSTSVPKKKGKEKVSLTYGRSRNEANKENDESIQVPSDHSSDNDEDTETSQGKTGKQHVSAATNAIELDAARKKFEEVDEWEMEFESVDAGGISSPWR